MWQGDCNSEPVKLLHDWYVQAESDNIYQPDAMALATVSVDWAPSVRMVLLKGYSDEGWLFFTNYLSRKGEDIAADNRVAATLWWGPVERSVRIEGLAQPCESEISDAYFDMRPRGSRIAAAISPQSQVVGAYEQLQRAHQAMDEELEGAEPARPDFWGGYLIVPDVYEFWQGKSDRLHERMRYDREDDSWAMSILAP